jgi:hypothetical protein
LDCAGNQHGNTRVCHMVMINLILIITISSRPSSRLTKPKQKKTVRDVERKFAKKEDVVERRRNGNQRADLKEGVSSPSQKHKAPLPVTASGRKAPVHYLWAVRCGAEDALSFRVFQSVVVPTRYSAATNGWDRHLPCPSQARARYCNGKATAQRNQMRRTHMQIYTRKGPSCRKVALAIAVRMRKKNN